MSSCNDRRRTSQLAYCHVPHKRPLLRNEGVKVVEGFVID
jgi:hypothetical protein